VNERLLLEDGSGILLHENGDGMLLEVGVPFAPFVGAEPFQISILGGDIELLLGREVLAEAFGLTLGFSDVFLARG